MTVQLSTGILLDILRCDNEIEEPVIQILTARKIYNSNGKDRWRVAVSDGKYKMTQAVWSGVASVEEFSIIKLKTYQLCDLRSATLDKAILILEAEVMQSGNKIRQEIGHPEFLMTTHLGETSSTINVAQEANTSTETSMKDESNLPNQSSLYVSANSSSEMSTENESNLINQRKLICPIVALTPYRNRWTIKGRVTNKSEKRPWRKGEGILFSFDLLDDSGEIRCVAFNQLAEKYFNLLQVDKVYYISKCKVRPANQRFNHLKHDYELAVGNETVIEECFHDDGTVPRVKYQFIPIAIIENLNVGSIIDVIGVCKETSELQQVTSRTTNREMYKRDICLVDQSQTSVTLTLWDSKAESFNGNNNPIVAIRGARVNEFDGGKTLSVMLSSQIKVNPDIEECHAVKLWYDREGHQTQQRNLSQRNFLLSFQTPWLCFREVEEKRLGNSDRGDYYQIFATVLFVRSENAVYKACPTQNCNKKVIDLENGSYRCDKCGKDYPNYKYRLLISMNIGDFSGNQWVNVFSEEAEKILGKTAQEMGLLMENDQEAATLVFQEANFKQFILKCRAKLEMYNDEQRVKTVVIHAEPVDFKKHNEHLLKLISEMTGISK